MPNLRRDNARAIERSSQAVSVSKAQPPKRRPSGVSCLFWALFALCCLLLIAVITVGAVFAGWSSGVAAARAQASGTSAAEMQGQCDRVPADFAAGNLSLAQRRLESLRLATPVPACLAVYAPTATVLYQQAQASPTAPATETMTATHEPSRAKPTATAATATDSATETSAVLYDLDVLLAQAQIDFDQRDFPGTIDTLSAIISLDADFQQERVRRLYLESLRAQAELLYRTSKLSEANMLTDRARAYGDVGSLNYEYFIADAYLNGQRYKTTNPAEAVRLLRRIVYEQGLPNYMNGQALSELQDALRYYADALALQGDACQAQDQYLAALELQPAVSFINRAALTTKRQAAEQTCATNAPAAVGVPSPASPAPVGQSG